VSWSVKRMPPNLPCSRDTEHSAPLCDRDFAIKQCSSDGAMADQRRRRWERNIADNKGKSCTHQDDLSVASQIINLQHQPVTQANVVSVHDGSQLRPAGQNSSVDSIGGATS